MSNILLKECETLTSKESKYVDIYTATAYHYLNTYLQGNDNINTYTSLGIKQLSKYLYNINNNNKNINIIYNDINKKLNENDLEWFRYNMYKYAILLYKTIYKCPSQSSPFIVYRGSLTHYLKEDTTKYYYLNTFTSTSTDINTSISFSKIHNNSKGIIYKFMIVPTISHIYIGDIEDEVLINPYNLYKYNKKDDNIYYYDIIPSSIIIPNSYKEFMNFKKNISNKSELIAGGKMDNIIQDINNKMDEEDVITIRINRNKNRKTQHNKKRNNQTKKINKRELARQRFRERMLQPIGTSSYGIVGTKEMDAQVEYLHKYFNLN